MENNMPDKIISDLQRDFTVVGNRHLHPFWVWGLLGLVVAFSGTMVYISNQSGQFSASEAARARLGGEEGAIMAKPAEPEDLRITSPANGNEIKGSPFLIFVQGAHGGDRLTLTYAPAGSNKFKAIRNIQHRDLSKPNESIFEVLEFDLQGNYTFRVTWNPEVASEAQPEGLAQIAAFLPPINPPIKKGVNPPFVPAPVANPRSAVPAKIPMYTQVKVSLTALPAATATNSGQSGTSDLRQLSARRLHAGSSLGCVPQDISYMTSEPDVSSPTGDSLGYQTKKFDNTFDKTSNLYSYAYGFRVDAPLDQSEVDYTFCVANQYIKATSYHNNVKNYFAI